MGDVVALRPGDRPSLSCRSEHESRSGLVPAWPCGERQVTISTEQARAIDRDIRHLDAVMERARDVPTLSMILSKIFGVEAGACERAARMVGMYLATGQGEA